MAKPCPNGEELLAYHIGSLAEDAAAAVIDHLSDCRACQDKVESLNKADDPVIDELRRPVPVGAYSAEPQYRRALDRARAVVGKRARGGGKSPGRSEAKPAAPRQLGEYRLLAKLGEGGMGAVYKALHTKLQREVALKVLPKGRLATKEAVARFEREMVAVGKLDHPNVVRAHDAREVGGMRFLVMEYVDGLDLSGLVQRLGPLPVADACELIRQAALGLQCAHEHGLVHRDVKPSNLMLTRDGTVKVLDLGLARVQSHLPTGEITDSGQFMGTADYVSPEQASDSRSADIRADIYSLGCTLYKLLVGEAPFAGPDYPGPMQKLIAHLQTPAPPVRQRRPEVPEVLAFVLDRMLAKDPDGRFDTPGQVADQVGAFATGADLSGLLAQAEGRPKPPLAVPLTPANTDAPLASPRVDTRLSRRTALSSLVSRLARGRWKPWEMATGVAAALLVTLVAWQIIVRIQKDGGEAVVQVPEGATATIDGEGNVVVTPRGQAPGGGVEPPALPKGTPDVSDEEAIREICRWERQAVAQRDFSDAGQSVWIGPYVLFVSGKGEDRAHVSNWDDAIYGWRKGLDALEEVAPCTEPPEYRIQGPIALGRWNVIQARVNGELQRSGSLSVLARRDGQWRIAAQIVGDWELTEQDRFDPADAEHQVLQQLCDGENRIYREKNLDLLADLYLPQCRGIVPDASDPETALVVDNEQARDAVKSLLNDETFHKPRVEIRYVKIEGALALALREEEGRPACLTLFARTFRGWRIGLNVGGDWQRFLFRKPRSAEDWCERVRDIWRRREFSRFSEIVWTDEFVGAAADPESGYGELTPWPEDETYWNQMQESIDQIEVPDEKPIYRADGPLAMVRWVSVRYRADDQWTESEGVEFLARRDGRWGGAAWLPGDWRLAATDVYDAENADHVAIQALLDEANRAFAAKDWDALGDTKHPSYRFLHGKGPDPEDAAISDLDQSLEIARGWMENAPLRERRATIGLIKVDGPLAITTGTSTQVAEDGTATQASVFNVYCRKPDGWRVALSVPGEWEPVFVEEEASREASPGRRRGNRGSGLRGLNLPGVTAPGATRSGRTGGRGGRQPGGDLP